ncbi:hypothetical protein N7495_000753 [Penicillium taxi]|uniref:uncharacterized protein n=1 Tax=Penicillium taxi TaxID=168475 RepID=UPI002545723E|nr:uncharacterized protein N7495_000753 [Penicillium taxi]KAJ5908071.1 hypothetical protein N7495_000753 [Penicillium taxi]
MAILKGECPSPFLQASLFPEVGGYIDGRYCAELSTNLTCCIPCPLADWRYPNDTSAKANIAGWISVALLPLCIFLLTSYAVLPAKWTNRHYLSTCITLGIFCMEIAFIIPLGAKPDLCYNEITPNDMYSNLSCAFSGSLLLFGGWMVCMWSFIRTIAFHLQVCWEVVLGRKFMWGAFVCGIGIPAIGMTVMLVLTGVSFRFGEVCHINIPHGLQDYWAPLMAFTVVSLVLQLSTMSYCIHIYLRSFFEKSHTHSSSGLPSYASSVNTQSARQTYRRIRSVLKLQWRGAALVLIIIGNVIFFSVIFVKMDKELVLNSTNIAKAIPWLECLVEGTSTEEWQACRGKAAGIGPNEATLLALIYLLALVGFWNFILFVRPSMFVGWVELFKSKFTNNHEFISVDAHGRRADSKGFEMLTSQVKSPEPETYMRSPTPSGIVGHTLSTRTTPRPSLDVRTPMVREARYVRPSMSFSAPRSPSAQARNEWDPSSSFAPGRQKESN